MERSIVSLMKDISDGNESIISGDEAQSFSQVNHLIIRDVFLCEIFNTVRKSLTGNHIKSQFNHIQGLLTYLEYFDATCTSF